LLTWLVGLLYLRLQSLRFSPRLDLNDSPMRFRLRTLMIALALGPALLWVGWSKYQAWKAEQDRRANYRDPNQLGLSPPRPVATQLGREETGKLGIEIQP